MGKFCLRGSRVMCYMYIHICPRTVCLYWMCCNSYVWVNFVYMVRGKNIKDMHIFIFSQNNLFPLEYSRSKYVIRVAYICLRGALEKRDRYAYIHIYPVIACFYWICINCTSVGWFCIYGVREKCNGYTYIHILPKIVCLYWIC